MLNKIRHYRGHGIHSPFVYRLVREVFMARRPINPSNPLYDELLGSGIGKRTALQIANLYDHCSWQGYAVSAAGGCGQSGRQLRIAPDGMGFEAMKEWLASEDGNDSALVVVSARKDRHTLELCREVGRREERLVIEKRRYIAVFGSGQQPKRYYKL